MHVAEDRTPAGAVAAATAIGEAATGGGRVRVAWPDATRGLGVLAVVLFHVLIWDHGPSTGGSSALAGLWGLTDLALERLRMPLLFALAGLLAADGLARGWHHGSARLRFAANYWLYAVWLTIYAMVFAALGQEDFPHAVDGLGAALAQVVVPATTLWFVLALACYPLVLTGLRAAGASPVTVLAVATLLWVVGSYAVLPGFTGKVVENFLFFVLGVHGAAHLWRWADGGWRPAAGFCGLFLVSVGLVTVVPDALVVPAVLLSSLAGIPASVVVIALCCRLPSVARAGSALGSRTLPVYLMHPLLLALWSLAPHDWVASFTSTPTGDALYAPLLTAVTVALCVLLHTALRRVPGNVLFTLPRPIRAKLAR